MKNKILIFSATFNECENIRDLLNSIDKLNLELDNISLELIPIPTARWPGGLIIYERNQEILLSEKIFSEDGNNYTVNHSSAVIILKDGKYVDRITHKENIDQTFKIFKKYLR